MRWAIGIGASMTIGWAGLLVGAFRSVLTRISKAEADSREHVNSVEGKMSLAVGELHQRVTRVREDTVHKSDLNDMSARVSSELREMRDANAKAHATTNERLDKLLAAIANRNSSHNRGD